MKRWFSVHRWLGWLLAPLLALSATTGAMLLWLQPLPASASRAPAAAAIAAALDHGMAGLRDSHPELKWDYVDLPRATGQAVRVRLQRTEVPGEAFWAELDPSSGAVISLVDDGSSAHAWLFGLHHELLWPEAGSWVMGGAGLLALLSLLIALRLWLRVRRLRAPRALRQWHRRVGIAMLVPLLITLTSGFMLSWPEAIRAPLGWLTGQPRFVPPPVPPGTAAPAVPAGVTPTSAGQVLLAGAAQLPGAVPTRLYAPKSGIYRLRLRTDEWHPNGLNNVFIGVHDGRAVRVVPWRDLPWSARYTNLVYPLHIAWLPGDAAAPVAILARLVWTATAMALIWMVASGMPWHKLRRRSSAKMPSQA